MFDVSFRAIPGRESFPLHETVHNLNCLFVSGGQRGELVCVCVFRVFVRFLGWGGRLLLFFLFSYSIIYLPHETAAATKGHGCQTCIRAPTPPDGGRNVGAF